MALSAFDDKDREPQISELEDVLLEAAAVWRELISRLESEFDPLTHDWGFSGKKWGWALRLKHKKRAVLYMTPATGFFCVGFALGKKAVAAAHESDLPRSVLDVIDGSQVYAEGRAVRLDVRSRRDLESVLQIARLKMTH
ncbi:MAG: DUF3788 domain-containing protein [Acidobacteriota bacterium]|nr:DUF3788 domain-containing protein [Acidobacteriota bacterium]